MEGQEVVSDWNVVEHGGPVCSGLRQEAVSHCLSLTAHWFKSQVESVA